MANIDVILPALTSAAGISAAIFTALRFNRDDASAVVNQQKEVLGSMKELNDELQEALDRARSDRVACQERCREQDTEIARLLAEVRVLRHRETGGNR